MVCNIFVRTRICRSWQSQNKYYKYICTLDDYDIRKKNCTRKSQQRDYIIGVPFCSIRAHIVSLFVCVIVNLYSCPILHMLQPVNNNWSRVPILHCTGKTCERRRAEYSKGRGTGGGRAKGRRRCAPPKGTMSEWNRETLHFMFDCKRRRLGTQDIQTPYPSYPHRCPH